jgi:hypothetical protein
MKFFFQIFLSYYGSTSNLEHACENLGGLGPLVWEEIENAETVLKFIYRSLKLNTFPNFETPSKIDLRNFFLALLGVANRHFFNN